MKLIKLNTALAGVLSTGALLMLAPGVSSVAGAEGLDIHGWHIDHVQVAANGADGLDIHGWRIEPAQVASTGSAYIGTSLKVDSSEELGFSDPQPGQSDY